MNWMGSLINGIRPLAARAPQADGHAAAGLTAFSGYDAPLRWGEAVPLSFLRTTLGHSQV